MACVYLVADLHKHPTNRFPPYWRVVGYFPNVIHATRFASPESVVTEWRDRGAAWKAYQSKQLPREGEYRILS